MNTEELAHLEELRAEATPLPWRSRWESSRRRWQEGRYTVVSRGTNVTGRQHYDGGPQMGVSREDAAYIVAACNAAPALVAEVRRLTAEPRPGQVLFNALLAVDPAFAESIRGGELDPYHVEGREVAVLRAWREASTAAEREQDPARATELEWLRWFVCNADFGPGASDKQDRLKRNFMDETGKNLPEGWNLASDGETSLDRPPRRSAP